MEHEVWGTGFDGGLSRTILDRLIVREDKKDSVFFYIPVHENEEVQQAQYDVLDGFPEGVTLEPVPPEHLHITLLFVEKMKDEQLEEFFHHLSYIVPKKFSVEVAHSGTFTEADDRPVILKLNPHPALIRLQNELYNIAFTMGLPIGVHSKPEFFTPHISVAYGLEPQNTKIPDLKQPYKIEVDRFVAARWEYDDVRTVHLPSMELDEILVTRLGAGIQDDQYIDDEKDKHYQEIMDMEPAEPDIPKDILIRYDPELEYEARQIKAKDFIGIDLGPPFWQITDMVARAAALCYQFGKILADELILGPGGAHEWTRADAMLQAPPDEQKEGFRYLFGQHSLLEAAAMGYASLIINGSQEMEERGYDDALRWYDMAMETYPDFHWQNVPNFHSLVREIGEEPPVPEYTVIIGRSEEEPMEPENGTEPELEGYVGQFAVSRSDFMHMLRGGEITYGTLKRRISIQDGPFVVMDDEVEPHKIEPPEPVEFRPEPRPIRGAWQEFTDLEPYITTGKEDEETLRERISNTLQTFVDRVADVFRGGPGSGHRGHAGRPGEVGGSLPSGATAVKEPTDYDGDLPLEEGLYDRRAWTQGGEKMEKINPLHLKRIGRGDKIHCGYPGVNSVFCGARVSSHVRSLGLAQSIDDFTCDKCITALEKRQERGDLIKRGGPGSGHHGHKGRPGEVGGSLPSGATAVKEPTDYVALYEPVNKNHEKFVTGRGQEAWLDVGIENNIKKWRKKYTNLVDEAAEELKFIRMQRGFAAGMKFTMYVPDLAFWKHKREFNKFYITPDGEMVLVRDHDDVSDRIVDEMLVPQYPDAFEEMRDATGMLYLGKHNKSTLTAMGFVRGGLVPFTEDENDPSLRELHFEFETPLSSAAERTIKDLLAFEPETVRYDVNDTVRGNDFKDFQRLIARSFEERTSHNPDQIITRLLAPEEPSDADVKALTSRVVLTERAAQTILREDMGVPDVGALMKKLLPVVTNSAGDPMYQTLDVIYAARDVLVGRGGPGSGYHDPHYGIPGKRGGSLPRQTGKVTQPFKAVRKGIYDYRQVERAFGGRAVITQKEAREFFEKVGITDGMAQMVMSDNLAHIGAGDYNTRKVSAHETVYEAAMYYHMKDRGPFGKETDPLYRPAEGEQTIYGMTTREPDVISSLLDNEREIIALEHEEARVIHPETGDLVIEKKGTKDMVRFTNLEVAKMAQMLLMHNHPSGKTFSIEDIVFAIDANIVEMYAISDETGRHVLRLNTDMTVGERAILRQTLQDSYREQKEQTDKLFTAKKLDSYGAWVHLMEGTLNRIVNAHPNLVDYLVEESPLQK
jgi:2'-5' RNA ligase